jgi:serine/threonine protein kinase
VVLQVELGKLIGSGGFAEVFSSTVKGQPCAVKCARKDKHAEGNEMLFPRELRVLARLSGLRHKNLLEFRGKIINPRLGRNLRFHSL